MKDRINPFKGVDVNELYTYERMRNSSVHERFGYNMLGNMLKSERESIVVISVPPPNKWKNIWRKIWN